jgi:hypothetical protein
MPALEPATATPSRSARARHHIRLLAVALVAVFGVPGAGAQEPPPKIGPYAVDLHMVVPKFSDDPQLAASRRLVQAELPGSGIGVSLGVHIYLPKIAGITVGLGGEAMIGRSSASPEPNPAAAVQLRPVTETFKEISPQLSLNFGNGTGWSYLSAGIGRALWSIVPEGRTPLDIDGSPLRTISYGGGARWFAKKRLAFSLDVRVYEIDGGLPSLDFPPSPPDVATTGPPGSPRTLLLVIGAGISVR